VPPDSSPRPDPRQAWALETPSLALALGGSHDTLRVGQQRDWVERAESLGLHSVWLPEMHFAPDVCPAPLVELAGFAARTERIRLGTTSLLLPLHPPEIVAAELAALDRISRGRLLLGLGRGFQRRMLEAFGVDPARKRDHFDASLDHILALWSEANGRGGPLATCQRPHPPLAVAAFGPKGLAQAARRGLPYLASPVETLDQIEANQRRHRALLPDPDARPLSLVMRSVFVSDDPCEVAAARRALAGELARSGGRMPLAVKDALAAPLDERALVGTPDAICERLVRERARLAIDLLIVRPWIAGLETESLERSLVRLAQEVWPEVCRRSRA
jgi:alkanesulfonate monooxygenase SsuD/methylene tetrahydromethanopterin reductase-like flavin-dependent oxidoreductase (luciferase family)